MKTADFVTIVLPSIVSVLYFATGVAFAIKKDWAWCLVWIAYAIANVGLVIAGNRG